MISIITPSFNQSGWLNLATRSVADQAGVTHEHIVQDSLSTDGTHDWLAKDTRVRAFFEKDAGMYDAINRGLRRAQGDICGYLNCDEQYLPGTLAKVASFFQENPDIDVLFGDAVLVSDKGEPLSYRRTILPDLRHVQLSHLNTLTCATFFRRALLDRGFYFNEQWRVIGDAIWIEDLLKARVKMATLSEPLSIFTFTGKNLTDTSVAEDELSRRNSGNRPARPWDKIQAVLVHRWRKALAGAYKRRHVEIDIFTLDSPNERQHRTGNIGFRWPSTNG